MKTYIKCSLLILFIPQVANAGLLIVPGISWSSFSFAPSEEEETPNYYGICPSIIFGYSAYQRFDFAFYSKYTPGNTAAAKVGEEDASFLIYGLHTALSFAETFKLSLRGGGVEYRYLSVATPEAITGHWTGSGGGIAMDALITRSKSFSFTVGVEYLTAMIDSQSDSSMDSRKIDQFSIGIGFQFNDFKASFIESKLFKGII